MNLKKFYDAANAAEARVQEIAAQINDLFEKNQNDEALKFKESLDQAQNNAKQAHQLYLSMLAATSGDGDPAKRFVPMGGDPEPKVVTELRASPEYREVFWDAFKNGVDSKTIKSGKHSYEKYGLLLNTGQLTETGEFGAEGGYLLPSDFDNKIVELMRTYTDLAVPSLFNIEDVTAYSGWRAIEEGTSTGFAAHTEHQTITNLNDEPEFARLPYTIVEYAGYLPIVTNLLNDTPVAIMAYLSRWFAKKAALTNTIAIAAELAAVAASESTYEIDQTDYKKTFTSIKTILNKTLDPAMSANAVIICNQNGLDLLDQLEDGIGRPLLQPDPGSATAFRVKGRPVVCVPTAYLADIASNTQTPFYIGDGHAWLTHFRRQPFAMDSTTVGGDAWRFNDTEVRGIMRFDDVVFDVNAMYCLDVTLP